MFQRVHFGSPTSRAVFEDVAVVEKAVEHGGDGPRLLLGKVRELKHALPGFHREVVRPSRRTLHSRPLPNSGLKASICWFIWFWFLCAGYGTYFRYGSG
jgi:hypothetical protein